MSNAWPTWSSSDLDRGWRHDFFAHLCHSCQSSKYKIGVFFSSFFSVYCLLHLKWMAIAGNLIMRICLPVDRSCSQRQNQLGLGLVFFSLVFLFQQCNSNFLKGWKIFFQTPSFISLFSVFHPSSLAVYHFPLPLLLKQRFRDLGWM